MNENLITISLKVGKQQKRQENFEEEE